MSEFYNWVVGTLNFTDLRMPPIEISTIIDVLIVAFLAYKMLTFFSRTRAWTFLKGISILGLVYFLSDIFRLHTIRWLVSNLFSVGIIAIIIIFQPEVRKALENIGKGRKFGIGLGLVGIGSSTEEEIEENKTAAIDEIITACKIMSAARTGALIVMGNEVPLGEYEDTGTRLDARVTHQLIVSIFEDKMPLHDGAIIITEGRLAAAGTILPLTEKDIAQELGTRHRAAIGISEVSDAIVIVVSNETGFISIATGGRLYKNLSEEETRSMLVGQKKPPKRKLVSFFRPK